MEQARQYQNPQFAYQGASAHPYGSTVLTPTSVSTSATFPSPPTRSSNRRPSSAVESRNDSDDQVNGDEPVRKKQKRNKPTLSCHECVERKTKVCAVLLCY
jgi:hypothetical protein